jgi:hypothetical protein
MIKRATALLLGSFVASSVLTLAPLSAQAAPASHFPPNPCRTFSRTSAAALLRIGSHTALTEKLSKTTSPVVIRTCTIRHRKLKLTVQTQFQPGATGNSRCFRRPALGSKGEICLSTVATFPFTFSVFHKHGVWVSAGINEQLRHQGARLYTFALAQYKSFSG